MNPPLTLTHRFPADAAAPVGHTLALSAEERTRSRHYFETETGQPIYLNLPRGTVLQHGDLLRSTAGEVVRIVAKPEAVFTVTAQRSIDLLRAAYHLGNRHVQLEVTDTYLRLSPDPVLRSMLEQLEVQVQTEIALFSPEVGAYGHRHEADHSHG